MIKLSALNEESDEDSNSEERVSTEAPKEIALQQYAKALDLQRKGHTPEATQLLKDLLDTELLYDIKKAEAWEKVSDPLINLKYLCYKNLAAILSSTGEIEAAIDAYTAASELDDTDVMLWYRLGLLCLQTERYERALTSFQLGAERNPRHWPCLDKIVTLLLALDLRKECIFTIYDALQLDPGYMRGLVYRKHIFTMYKHERDYLEYLNPIYRWNEEDDESVDEEKAKELLKEAEDIREVFMKQQQDEQFKYILPHLKLKKPITQLTWTLVGEALVDMHHYMTDNCFSHACPLEMVTKLESQDNTMDVCEEDNKEPNLVEGKVEEVIKDNEKNMDIFIENENNDMSDKDKPLTDTEKFESDLESSVEPRAHKKSPVRRRRPALRHLQQWEWCNYRPSGRKKHTKDRSIYDTLRRMVPIGLVPQIIQKNENQDREVSPDIADLDVLFDCKDGNENIKYVYFDTEDEKEDVKSFIDRHLLHKHDIIDTLKDYLAVLAEKWRMKWPNELIKAFVEANECYNKHIEVPACTDDNEAELYHYIVVNLLVEELVVNEKLNASGNEKKLHDLSVTNTIGIMLTLKPYIFDSTHCFETTLRHLWVKAHICMLNNNNEFRLDCLHDMWHEFNALEHHRDYHNLNIVNFTYKSAINIDNILEPIVYLERNMKLETVKDLFNKGCYEEVAAIVNDTFQHFKTIAKENNDIVSLDFAAYLIIILDTYWALGKVDTCLQWSFTCLHESLKHYFRHTSGSIDYEKWTMAVVKILSSMEHILSTEGLLCLDSVSPKELSQGLEDLIRIIGHQVETKAAEMPLETVAPWIIMHYILQREEDLGRGRAVDQDFFEDIPYPLMVLFIGHEQLGDKSWCSKFDSKLLYFILDTVVPRMWSPSLSKSFEIVCQFMEQCVYCLFGHPVQKSKKAKYVGEHNVKQKSLDWFRAQQLFEIFRPPVLPGLEGKVSGISGDTEILFNRILALLPPECDPHKYVPDMKKYMKGIEEKLPVVPPLLPYKMKDIFFLLGDFHFKNRDLKSIKFSTLDVIVNNDRFNSWAQISLAKAMELERLLNSCKNFKNDVEFLNPARTAIRCFKRSLQLEPTHREVRVEYGNFAYSVHSFCSRLLKQASESLSMEDFESLEKQKEDMLDTTQKCFSTVLGNFNGTNEKSIEDSWQVYYMLGKVAEKRNKPPSIYLDYYLQGIKFLHEIEAVYPAKINYSTPTHLCIEVLELHYRIHASILKYIEQHENKPIPASVGKVFSTCIDDWLQGPFTRKKRQEGYVETEGEAKPEEPIQAANILKRSISDAGEEDTHEAKRLKLELAAAKVRRSASYDTERAVKETPTTNASQTDPSNAVVEEVIEQKDDQEPAVATEIPTVQKEDEKYVKILKNPSEQSMVTDKKEESSSSSSSSSSSDSSSSDSTSDSSSDSSRESDTSSKSSNETRPLTDDEIMKIVSACLDALEDCASRFPQHYKAIYRLAHYHFYYKKGRDIERCRDLMLSTFISRFGQKLGGLFSERKQSNFFNNIWKIPSSEVDRAGSFPFHMNRSVLLTMEILKEIDDHKTLLELSMHLQRTPDQDKKYLRDSDREELAQQAISLCVQSLRGQLTRFSQQADLRSNEVEQQALKCLMLDIFKAYQRAQKQPSSKQFVNLLIDGYKLLNSGPFENKNLVDLSMKYCQSLRQQSNNTSLDKSQNLQKKQATKTTEIVKTNANTAPNPPKQEHKPPASSSTSSSALTPPALPKMSAQEMAAAFQNYVPLLHDPLLTQQAAAALSLSYLSNISATMALQNSLQSTLQYSALQNSFQAEFYRQCVGQSFSSFNLPPPKKQKRGPKASSTNRSMPVGSTQSKPSKPATSQSASVIKAIPTPVITQKPAAATLAPSMGTVLSTLPASMTANLTSFGGHSTLSHSGVHSSPSQAHMSSSSAVNAAMHSKPPMPLQQVSPGKTLQEKLAERQKNLPSVSKASSHDSVSREISQSISRLPSSLTITKTSVPKQPLLVGKRPESKKSLPFSEVEHRPKPVSSEEIIILDDD